MTDRPEYPERPERPTCPFSDAILAHFVDGEVAPIDAGDRRPQELADHLRQCELCETSVAAARRLDALVASAADTTIAPAAAERLLRTALARAPEPAAVRAPAPATGGRRALVGVLLIAAGFVAALVLQAMRARAPAPEPAPPQTVGPPTRAEPDQNSAVVAAPDVHLAPDMIVLPDLPGRRPRTRGRPAPWHRAAADEAEVEALARICERSDLPRALAASVFLRDVALCAARSSAAGRFDPRRAAPDTGDPLLRAGTEAAAAAVRAVSLAALLASRHPRAVAEVERFLAQWPDGAELRSLARSARTHPDVLRRLRQGLLARHVGQDVVRAAVRVGHEDLDEALRRWVDGDAGRAEQVVAGVRAVGERRGRTRLLLALWQDLAKRGLADDGMALADRWFDGLGQDAAAELLTALATTRNAAERRRCLEALAAVGDGSASLQLTALLDDPRRTEAALAAYALGCIPAGADRLVEAMQRIRHRYLLLAALACRKDPDVVPWVDDLRLTPEERQFVLAGDFNVEQFRIATALFRERSAAGD